MCLFAVGVIGADARVLGAAVGLVLPEGRTGAVHVAGVLVIENLGAARGAADVIGADLVRFAIRHRRPAVVFV